MERVSRGATMGGRIGQRLDHLVELNNRPWPAMGDDKRHRLGVRRAHVDEMDVKTVDLGGELRETIEQCLAPAPVVVFGPVPADLLNPFQRRALAPVVDQFSLRPTGLSLPGLQVVEDIVPDRDTEWLHRGGHAPCSFENLRVCSRHLIGRPKHMAPNLLCQRPLNVTPQDVRS
jgi:hypothetical protein